MVEKKELKELFKKDWKKHYELKVLVSEGFQRKQCMNCKNFFWTMNSEREICADSSCMGYEFIGQATKKLDYLEAWKKVEEFFEKRNVKVIPRYPTVCRWRDDLYFTNASIIDFQPFVVSGEMPPPANPLLVMQPSIRFGDVSNVGVTGRHYTSFTMIGQTSFNTSKTGEFYWKNEAIDHDLEMLQKVLGIKKEEITFAEDVWAGGGTFGPSMEYMANGIELGNCVFMQFKDLGQGKFEELKTKVIDMGAGLERFAWFTNGSPTSYEITFGPVIGKMKKDAGVKFNEKLFQEYAKLSGILNYEEQGNAEKRKAIAKKLGVSEEELFGMLKPLQALYAIADHLKTILYTSTDSMLPSNAGGGYNLRMILRRVFGFNEEFNFNLDFAKILEGHAEYLSAVDSTLKEQVQTTIEVMHEERKKFAELKENSKRKVEVLVTKMKKDKKEFLEKKELMKLYESDGIPLELVEEVASSQGIKLESVENFYGELARKNEVEREENLSKKVFNVSGFPKTKELFYEDRFMKEFTAKILGSIENYLILDQTCFYAEAGGQAGDKGLIEGVKVLDTQTIDGVVLHEIQDVSKFKKGQKVFGQIDWHRRWLLMRHHTGTHVVNAAAREVLGEHVFQAGSHKEVDKAHLDLTHFKKISEQELKEIELEANKIVAENHLVTLKVYKRNEAEKEFGFRIYQGGYVPGLDIRIINIEGVDVEACCGTHVQRTGDIGLIKIIKRETVKDGVERLSYACTLSGIEFMQKREQLIKDTAETLNVPEVELASSANKIVNELKNARKEVEKLREQINELQKENLKPDKDGKIFFVTGFASIDQLTSLSEKLAEKFPEATVFAANSSSGEFVVKSGSKAKKTAKKFFEELKSKLELVGGGREDFFRGKSLKPEKLRESNKQPL